MANEKENKIKMKARDLLRALKTISVEPVIFCCAMASAYHGVVYRAGIYRVICQKLYGDDPGVDCAVLRNSTYGNAPELAVQRAASDWNIQSALSYMIPATIADIMLGAMGDRYGRKLNIHLGIVGMMTVVVSVSIVFGFPSTMPMFFLLIANVIAGLTGFVSIVTISAYAYLADTIVDKDFLTVRMTLMQVCLNVGSIFGPLVASGTSKVMTNAMQETITISLLVISFVVCLLVLRQVPPAIMRKKMMERHAREKQAASDQESNAGMNGRALELGADMRAPGSKPQPETTLHSSEKKQGGNCILTVCWASFLQLLKSSATLIKEVWQTYRKRREGHTRAYILIASFVVFVSIAAELGLRYSIFGQYVQKAPLNWNQEMIGYYDAANGAVTTAGTITGILVFKKLLGMSDTTVVLIALASGIAESMLMAFGTKTWMLFVSAVIGCLSSLVKPCVQSFVAKLVAPDEVGKAFTIFGISQNVAYLLSSIVFNNIYKKTLETFPGLAYVLGAFILLVVFILVLWVHIDQRAADHKCSGMESLKVWITERSQGKKNMNNPVIPVKPALELELDQPIPA